MRDLDAHAATDQGWTRLRPARRALALCVVLLVVTGGWWALRASIASDGAPVISDPGFEHGLTVDASPTGGPGLHQDDLVTHVNATSLDDWLGHAAPTRPNVTEGQRLTYRVERDGRREDVVVTLD